MAATDEFAAALDAGDYRGALTAYRATEHAQSSIGKPTEAFLLALAGEHGAAGQHMQGVTQANVIEAFVRGERERHARWTDVRAAGSMNASEPLPYLGVYAGTSVALLQGDKALIDGAIAADKAKIPPVAGTLTFRSGDVREFSSIVDSDDGIGAMLETYGADGLLYIPFASLRSVRFAPPRTFMDSFIVRGDAVLADGTQTMVIVPMLYALSSTAGVQTIRTGRETRWEYVGSARRGIGQRDFVLDGGTMIGLQNVAAIELRGTARPATKAAPRPAPEPLPRARVDAGGAGAEPTSRQDVLMLVLVVAVIVAVLVAILS
ncbi:MAG TPA: type VI secretion system accessory protein TagJ [Kofleriaceae bacterium]|nr:type VI secretion system accessory protein TagJ [Kofleriaceae bacterium]